MFSLSGHMVVSFPETQLPKQSATDGWDVWSHSCPWPQSESGAAGVPRLVVSISHAYQVMTKIREL